MYLEYKNAQNLMKHTVLWLAVQLNASSYWKKEMKEEKSLRFQNLP